MKLGKWVDEGLRAQRTPEMALAMLRAQPGSGSTKRARKGTAQSETEVSARIWPCATLGLRKQGTSSEGRQR